MSRKIGLPLVGEAPNGAAHVHVHKNGGPSPEQPAAAAETVLAGEAAAGLPAVVDKVVAATVLFLAAPIMAVLSVLVRLDSPGPAVFRQRRIGTDARRGADRRQRAAQPPSGIERRRGERRRVDLRGRPFVFYKFRTMRSDSRERFPDLFAFEVSKGGLSRLYLQMPDDPRVSRIGRFLRHTSLDELPNFINVLKGDMALVGPRPEMVEMAKHYDGDQRLKFRVRPGVTGKAQVNGRGLLNFPDTVALDVAYVRERSLANDLRLLMKTVVVIVKGSGAF